VSAWSILSIIPLMVGMKGSVHPAQASTRTPSSTEITLASTLSGAAALVTATSSPAKYVVQYGDTLSGIAARFAVRGGWPALYAANRSLIGPDPNVIEPGSVLVLPGLTTPVRYTVAPGDTLSAIAAGLAVPGGWPALYAANRRVIGPDPDVIHPGTVLKVPGAAPSRPRPSPRPRENPAPPPSPGAGSGHVTPPARKGAPAATGMPRWLTTALLAVALFVLAAFVAEPVLVTRWRRKQAAAPQPVQTDRAPGPGRPGGVKAQIVLADHERLVVTCDRRDDTVYVLRPPGEDPKAIMRVARLVLPEDPYRELAEHLGVPASWPLE
jgi:LysM repeat protein